MYKLASHEVKFIFSSLALVCFSCLSKPSRVPETPNIILILTDDQGYGDLGCYRSTNKTINLSAHFPEIVQMLTNLADSAREDIGDYGVKGRNSRPVGSVYNELQHVSLYPQSKYNKEKLDIMLKEMKEFQKKRFDKLKTSVIPLNKQEQEEFNYYREILK